MVGNDPTGRNHGRAAGGGDPATNAGSVLERGREGDDVGKDCEWVWGVRTPLPVLIPTRSNRRGSTARAEVLRRGDSTAQPGGSKKLLPHGDGSTVLPQAVVPWLAAVVP